MRWAGAPSHSDISDRLSTTTLALTGVRLHLGELRKLREKYYRLRKEKKKHSSSASRHGSN